MKGYSTEYAAAIILFAEAILKKLGVDVPGGMVGQVIEAVIVLWSFGNLLYKRFGRGGVNALGVRV